MSRGSQKDHIEGGIEFWDGREENMMGFLMQQYQRMQQFHF